MATTKHKLFEYYSNYSFDGARQSQIMTNRRFRVTIWDIPAWHT